MNKILFVSQPKFEKSSCGIYLIGKLLSETLEKSKKFKFKTYFINNKVDLNNAILENDPICIIYNYHETTTPWLNGHSLNLSYPKIKHVIIHHDMHQSKINSYNPIDFSGFEKVISPDPTLIGNKYVFPVNRLIPPYTPNNYIENQIPIIGFQGFGAKHKGIDKIARKVQEEFDEAIIRLHIPHSFYSDPNGAMAMRRVNEVKSIINKPNIKIEHSHNLLSTKEIIDFLNQNTINCYFNDYLAGAGLASSPDYALATNRPIAVTKSHQLRNFLNLKPSICIEDNSLKDIISFGLEPLKEMKEKYSEKNVINDYENAIENFINI
jgi:hypothetical protein